MKNGLKLSYARFEPETDGDITRFCPANSSFLGFPYFQLNWNLFDHQL